MDASWLPKVGTWTSFGSWWRNRGADVNVKDNNGVTALPVVVAGGLWWIVQETW
jgi:hypothetical protein